MKRRTCLLFLAAMIALFVLLAGCSKYDEIKYYPDSEVPMLETIYPEVAYEFTDEDDNGYTEYYYNLNDLDDMGSVKEAYLELMEYCGFEYLITLSFVNPETGEGRLSTSYFKEKYRAALDVTEDYLIIVPKPGEDSN